MAGTDAIRAKLLLEMNRTVLAGVLAGVVFFVLLGITQVGPVPVREAIEDGNALWEVFSPLVSATITAVVIVVTFNQLVLSQELGALGDQRERMEGAMEFRQDMVPWLSRPVVPAEPATFVALLLAAIRTRAERAGTYESTDPDPLLTDTTNRIADEAGDIADRLEDVEFGTFSVINEAMQFDYSRAIHEVELVLALGDDSLEEESRAALSDLHQILSAYGPAREHFKTLYFQWELVNLSRRILYTAVPALLIAMGMMLTVTPDGVSGTILGIDALTVLICAGVTLVLVPFLLLLSYVLRIATIAKRTLAIGPFRLRRMDS